MNSPDFQKTVVASGEQPIMQLYDSSLVERQRILYPQDAAFEQELLLENMAALKSQGGHIAIVDGAFDVPHDNHTWYLREVRRIASEKHFGTKFTEASKEKKRAMVASDAISLLVTLDADIKIAQKKGFNPEKGNVSRPVYTWEARANRIGGFMIPASNGLYRPAIDLVTVEGDPSHCGTMFESHLEFGRTLVAEGLLDTWILFDEHVSAVDEATSYAADNETAISVVSQHEARFAIDPRTGTHWSSSAIINSIKGMSPSDVPVS